MQSPKKRSPTLLEAMTEEELIKDLKRRQRVGDALWWLFSITVALLLSALAAWLEYSQY